MRLAGAAKRSEKECIYDVPPRPYLPAPCRGARAFVPLLGTIDGSFKDYGAGGRDFHIEQGYSTIRRWNTSNHTSESSCGHVIVRTHTHTHTAHAQA